MHRQHIVGSDFILLLCAHCAIALSKEQEMVKGLRSRKEAEGA